MKELKELEETRFSRKEWEGEFERNLIMLCQIQEIQQTLHETLRSIELCAKEERSVIIQKIAVIQTLTTIRYPDYKYNIKRYKMSHEDCMDPLDKECMKQMVWAYME